MERAVFAFTSTDHGRTLGGTHAGFQTAIIKPLLIQGDAAHHTVLCVTVKYFKSLEVSVLFLIGFYTMTTTYSKFNAVRELIG
jgi:hypothetical protein